VAVEIPALLTARNLDAAAGEALYGHARRLQNWLAGILHWHQGCRRYSEPDLAGHTRLATPAVPGALTGLGTSAARLRPLAESKS
jgi:germacradienol/geosmin synthase